MTGHANREKNRPGAFPVPCSCDHLRNGRRVSGDNDLPRGVFDGNGHGMTITVVLTAQHLHHLPREVEDSRHGSFAHGNFHADLLKGRKVVVACPKLDDIDPQLEKFASLLANNAVKSLTAARMEVPCCGGIVKFAQDAVRKAGINLPVNVVIVGIDGTPHK